ncbi:MAG: hypothetical protein AB7V50_11225, partial [Vampirovibrionia bacterium]
MKWKYILIGLAFSLLIVLAVFLIAGNILLKAMNVSKESIDYNVFNEPIQEIPCYKEPIVLEGDGYKHLINFKAKYKVSAQIKGKKRYTSDWNAAISPYDLLLVWGKLADNTIDDHIHYSQSGRWYHSKFNFRECPFSTSYINDHAANTHIIPANTEVRKELESINVNQNVHLEGYLIYLEGLYKGK